jgi:hypothetical protein
LSQVEKPWQLFVLKILVGCNGAGKNNQNWWISAWIVSVFITHGLSKREATEDGKLQNNMYRCLQGTRKLNSLTRLFDSKYKTI